MTCITIECRLVTNESTRRHFWHLMGELNTPLINELLQQIPEHPDFNIWQLRGYLPAGLVQERCNVLKTDTRFQGQPSRFYKSAIALVDYIYKSWFKIQKRLQYRLKGQQRWLEILKSDELLEQECESSLEVIRDKANELIAIYTSQVVSPILNNQQKTSKKQPKNQKPDSQQSKSLFQLIREVYQNTHEPLTKSAACYLLKNRCRIPQKPETTQAFLKRRRKVEIRIERLLNQIEQRIPEKRDLKGEKRLIALIDATNTAPDSDEQTRAWKNQLLTKPKSIPFPVNYETNEDLIWSKNQKGRLCVRFNGLSEHSFEIYCDQRHLKYFERFYEDQQIKKNSQDNHSSGLFTLRSGRIVWQECQGKGLPWNLHRLTLHCSLDTRLWSCEGTDLVRQEKAEEIASVLTKMQEKGDLSKNQIAFIQRKNTSLERIKNPFPRPSQPLYQGQPHLILGVALGLEKTATVAVVDAMSGKAIAYRSIKQLLGENYRLLNRQRNQKQYNAIQRHKAQQNDAENQFGESELGEYIDRLLAKAIISVAKQYRVSSIVLPKLEDIRELVQSELQTRAETKIPGYIEGQKKYAKQYRMNIHRWSYGRLSDNIKVQASKIGLVIEESKPKNRGSPYEQAETIAIAAYSARSQS